MIKSTICEILGIKYPLFQGGMAWIADASLAAAVSNAGGLGLISSINTSTEAVREQIRLCRTLTDKPFGVNIMLMAPNAAEVADLVIEEGIKVVTTGAGSPSAYMEKWKAAGIKVIPVVASVAYALKMQELGATAVIADDIAFATAKKARTDLRKHKDAITQARISINALLLGDFNTQLKNIETILDNADKDIKARVDEYNLAKKGNDTGKPKVISLVVKGYDAKAIEKVKAQALKLGLSAEVK